MDLNRGSFLKVSPRWNPYKESTWKKPNPFRRIYFGRKSVGWFNPHSQLAERSDDTFDLSEIVSGKQFSLLLNPAYRISFCYSKKFYIHYELSYLRSKDNYDLFQNCKETIAKPYTVRRLAFLE
jgi:hypothetical protein